MLVKVGVSVHGHLRLSPYDRCNLGRSVPMTWFFKETLDVDSLVDSLRASLQKFPFLCGRYNATPPSAIELKNEGVQVYCVARSDVTLGEATAHLLRSGEATSIFARSAHEPYAPSKEDMDPDTGRTDVPLMRIKLTTFERGGGSAIGVLAQHGVLDAEGIMLFVQHWARASRGLCAFATSPPAHGRFLRLPLPDEVAEPLPFSGMAHSVVVGSESNGQEPMTLQEAAAHEAARPERMRVHCIAPGEARPPEFASVMPLINGPDVCLVGFTAATLRALKAQASASLPEGGWVSTDDVLSAHTWRALVRMRCTQLGLPTDSEVLCTCSRALNVRTRLQPPLPAGYCGNATDDAVTCLSVRELLSSSAASVAHKMRADVSAMKADVLARNAAWLYRAQVRGCATRRIFDERALTVIISSWRCDWEEACGFGNGAAAVATNGDGGTTASTPVAFDHGALTPIVAVFTNMPSGDGLSVYASGPRESLEGVFVREMERVRTMAQR